MAMMVHKTFTELENYDRHANEAMGQHMLFYYAYAKLNVSETTLHGMTHSMFVQ